MKIVFMGTPDFAAGALQAIVDNGHDVRLVVTQPDKVRGRGGMVSASPVKECALKNNIEVFQPVKIKEKENVDRLKSIDADVYVVAAFGQILSEEILNIPPFGCINIHASLLPKYRGAAPIQWCILNGETKTGVTIMQMDKGVDTGDILYTKTIDIDSKETGEGLFDKLSALGAEAICEALPLLEQGKLKAMPQDESEATHVGMLKKEMGEIDWKRSACEIERLIRGLNSWPSAYTYINGRSLKIWDADVVKMADITSNPGPSGTGAGTIIKKDKKNIYVACGEDILKINSLQLEGKKRMDTASFLLGYSVETGDKLGR